MSMIVFGGAGYIGSHTVYGLIEAGWDVAVVDNLQTGYRQAIHPKARFYQGDIRDSTFLKIVFQKERPEAVIHFAANSLVCESMQDPLKYYDNNLYGTMVLLGAMKEAGVKHIVFSSTAAVYGEPERIPITEKDRTNPTNTYGETKLSMERMMKWCDSAYRLRYTALRYFNAGGAHVSGNIGEAHNPETHLIPMVLQAALGKRKCVQIYGEDYDTKDGTCVRDYIHVTDLCQAHILAMEYLLKGGESNVFNLGNGAGFSVKEVIDVAEKVVGRPIPAEVVDRRPGDPARLIASSDKCRKLLGWNPRHDALEEIIASAWNWLQKHPSGFD